MAPSGLECAGPTVEKQPFDGPAREFIVTTDLCLRPTLNVQFKADWFNIDGRDNYFLISAKPTIHVPEPGTLALLGLAAIGAALGTKRRRKD
jgi:hypothetical protein